MPGSLLAICGEIRWFIFIWWLLLVLHPLLTPLTAPMTPTLPPFPPATPNSPIHTFYPLILVGHRGSFVPIDGGGLAPMGSGEPKQGRLTSWALNTAMRLSSNPIVIHLVINKAISMSHLEMEDWSILEDKIECYRRLTAWRKMMPKEAEGVGSRIQLKHVRDHGVDHKNAFQEVLAKKQQQEVSVFCFVLF